MDVTLLPDKDLQFVPNKVADIKDLPDNYLKLDGSNSPMIGTNSTTFLQIQQADTTPVFNVDTTNVRVGIGTTSPGAKLTVYGSDGVDNGISLKNTAGHDWRIFTDITNIGLKIGGGSGTDNFWETTWSGAIANLFKSPSGARTSVPIVAKGAAFQTANTLEIQGSTGTVLSGADERGILFSNGGSNVNNVYIGDEAGNNTVGAVGHNVGIGSNSLQSVTTAQDNVGIGFNSLKSITTGGGNFGMGTGAFDAITTGTQNIGVGTGVGGEITDEIANTFIGTAAGGRITGDYNVGIGYASLQGASGSISERDYNVGIGRRTGWKLTSGSDNVLIGSNAGGELTSGSDNVFIGHFAGTPETTGSNKLYIANSDTTIPLIYGEFDNSLLRVNGHQEIIGNSNTEQLVIKGYSTQTDALTLWQQADGTDVAIMTNDGYIGLGRSFTNARIDIYNDVNETNITGIRMKGATAQTQPYLQVRTAGGTDLFRVNSTGTIAGSPEDDSQALLFQSNINYTDDNIFFRLAPTIKMSVADKSMTTLSLLAFIDEDSEDIASYTASQYRVRVQDGYSGTITNTNGIVVGSLDLPSGTVTNNYGIVVTAQTAGTNNWAIKTGEGLVEFGDLVIGDHPTIRLEKDTATQNVGGANGTTTAISWDSQDKIDDDWFTHDTSTNNTRITVNTAGTYSVKATVSAEQGGANRTTWKIYGKKNGTTDLIKGTGRNYSRGSGYGDASMNWITEIDLEAEDYIEVIVEVDDTDATYTANTIDGECEVIIKKLS